MFSNFPLKVMCVLKCIVFVNMNNNVYNMILSKYWFCWFPLKGVCGGGGVGVAAAHTTLATLTLITQDI